jgi:hypothetical protein
MGNGGIAPHIRTLALDGVWWSSSRPGHFCRDKVYLNTHSRVRSKSRCALKHVKGVRSDVYVGRLKYRYKYQTYVP